MTSAADDFIAKSLNFDQVNVRFVAVREAAVKPVDTGASGVMVTPSE